MITRYSQKLEGNKSISDVHEEASASKMERARESRNARDF